MPRPAPPNTPPVARCAATTRKGTPCRRKPGPDGLCPTHRGRHRPSLLTPETERTIIDALKTGNTRTGAAQLAGIHTTTLYRWLERGQQDEQNGLDTPYSKFRNAVSRAEAEAKHQLLLELRRHAQGWLDDNGRFVRGDWRAAAWLLERRWPEEFSERHRVDATITPLAPRFDDPHVAEIADRVLDRRTTQRDNTGR